MKKLLLKWNFVLTLSLVICALGWSQQTKSVHFSSSGTVIDSENYYVEIPITLETSDGQISVEAEWVTIQVTSDSSIFSSIYSFPTRVIILKSNFLVNSRPELKS